MQTLISLKNRINHLSAETINTKLQTIIKEGGSNSKQFWKIYRQVKKLNDEDIEILITEDGQCLYTPDDIMEYNAYYYEELYFQKSEPHVGQQWTNYIEKEMAKYEHNFHYDDLTMNQLLELEEIH